MNFPNLKLSAEEAQRKIEELMKMDGWEDYQVPDGFSGGQKPQGGKGNKKAKTRSTIP